MKKSIIVLTVVLTMGLGLSSAYAWYCGGPGAGPRGWNQGAEAYKKFLEETAQIRKSLAVDRAELNAVMAGPNPDPKKVAELTGRIVDNQEALAEIAGAANINAGFGCGFGRNAACPGPGFGYGRGYGRCR
jgi:hypothetical protein